MLLLIDANNLVYRCSHAHRHIRTSQGEFVGGLHGTWRSIQNLLWKFQGYLPILVWDSRSLARKRIYAGYKAGRHDDEFRLEIKHNIKMCRYVLDLLGLRSVFIPTIEADDILAYFALRNPSILVSTDKDFFQLLDFEVSISRGTEDTLFTRDTLRDKYDVTPLQYRLAHVLAGDHSDGVPGVPGIGDLKPDKGGVARSLIEQCPKECYQMVPNWRVIFEYCNQFDKKAMRFVCNNPEYVIRSYQLIDLLCHRFISDSLIDLSMRQIHQKRYGFEWARAASFMYTHDYPEMTGKDCGMLSALMSRTADDPTVIQR